MAAAMVVWIVRKGYSAPVLSTLGKSLESHQSYLRRWSSLSSYGSKHASICTFMHAVYCRRRWAIVYLGGVHPLVKPVIL